MTNTPRETLQTLGHSGVEQSLLSLIERKQLPQTLLFHGAKGIGKATFAYQLACYLFGGAAPDSGGLFGDVSMKIDKDAPCVRRVMAQSHADLLVIEPELSGQNQVPVIKVDAARQASEFLSKTASESNWRVVIIDGAEALNVNAANALLKVIEEPPLNALMILVSHQPGKLLPTLLSRCRKYAFQSPNSDIFKEVISEIISDTLDELYLLSYGSPGRAIELADKGAVSQYATILELLNGYPTLSKETLTNLVNLVEKQAKTGSFSLWCSLWCMCLTRLNLAACGGVEHYFSSLESELFARLNAAKPARFWQAALQESQSLIGAAQALHLERKQVITSLIEKTFGLLEIHA